jgi:succinate dehydrogenase / fumarate reductase, cytochrome b subunit
LNTTDQRWRPTRRRPFIVDFYSSAIGKKWAMAVSGIALLFYVFAHLIGNLKLFLGEASLNTYAEFLREMGEPILPFSVLLWILRIGLIVAFVVHIHASYALTVINRRARPLDYAGPREYLVANYASRTMRWSGVIVLLFLLYHLADLTWGWANPDFVRGEVYNNVIASLSRWPVALLYIAASIALGFHIYHGAWSMFQSMGINNPRFNRWRRWFAQAFAAFMVVGNVSLPVAVLAGWVPSS